MVNWIHLLPDLATLISIVVAGVMALRRSFQVERGRLEEDFVDYFLGLTDASLKELRELSALDPVVENPQQGQIEGNELLLRTWRIVEAYRSLRYRALAFGERATFVENLSKTIDGMKDAYDLLKRRDATGLNKMKYSVEQIRLEFFDGFDGGSSRLTKLRNEFVASERQRIEDSYNGYI